MSDEMLRLYCEECSKEIIVVEGVTAIFDRGCWWCAKHVKPAWGPVSLDSPGKLIPRTIIQGDAAPDAAGEAKWPT